MSLIDEALRRARESASRGNPSARTKGYPWIPANMPDRGKARRAMWSGLAGGAIVALAVAAGAYWLWLKPAETPRRPRTAATANRPPAPLPTVAVAPPDFPSPELRATTTRPVPRPLRSAAAAARPGPPAAPETGAPDSATPPRSSGTSGEEGERTQKEAPPRSSEMSLEGIVYSEAHPVAMINGALVAVGGVVGDYVVEQIAPDRVVLRGPGGRRTLRLK